MTKPDIIGEIVVQSLYEMLDNGAVALEDIVPEHILEEYAQDWAIRHGWRQPISEEAAFLLDQEVL